MRGARTVPDLVVGLCDDAAVFPPGSAPLPAAVAAHLGHGRQWYAPLVGPLVVPASMLVELGRLLPPGVTLPVSVTFPDGPDGVRGTLAAASALPVNLRSVEVAVPPGTDLRRALTELGAGGDVGDVADVVVEVPRDGRAASVLELVAAHGLRAKFRTGGVRAELYPDEAELTRSLAAAVRAGVPFKATAGLHHAVRNTDPATGIEQHGFLNVLLATDALLTADDEAAARTALAEVDGAALGRWAGALAPDRATAVRAAFTSFGTCSITDPLAELVALGVVAAPAQEVTRA